MRIFFFLCFFLNLHGTLQEQYETACRTPSDIYEHVPTLRSLAKECSSVTEIGLRSLVSTWGILLGLSESSHTQRSYVGIDIEPPPFEKLSLAQTASQENGIAFQFLQANDMDIDIEPTEMLFIDSLHTYCHLTFELEKFSPKVSQYIALHDTHWPEVMDDPSYKGDYSEYPAEYDRTKKGLWLAVADFLERHPEWILAEDHKNNYGLTILKRAEQPKIYDCFTFFDELEILEIKLNELYDHVDYFVLVESTETFRGTPKPLYFADNKERFGKFLDKIIHVQVSDILYTDNPWEREYFQRNQILRGLTHCKENDIIIIEDLDEIISAAKLPEFIHLLQTGRRPYLTCDQLIYTYYLNRRGHAGGTFNHWLGSVVTTYAAVELLSPQGIRNLRSQETAIPSGWHFTYMGGYDRVRKKLESFSHSELDNESYKSFQRMQADLEAIELVEIDESYPQFIRDNIPYFQQIGFIEAL